MTTKTQQAIQVNTYEIVCRAVEDGLNYGWNRSHKHTDKPDEFLVKQEMENAIMNALCEVLIFPENC